MMVRSARQLGQWFDLLASHVLMELLTPADL
jgi:hypothetical protein